MLTAVLVFIACPATSLKLSRNGWRNTTETWRLCLERACGTLDKQIWSTKAPPHNLQDFKDLLPRFSVQGSAAHLQSSWWTSRILRFEGLIVRLISVYDTNVQVFQTLFFFFYDFVFVFGLCLLYSLGFNPELWAATDFEITDSRPFLFSASASLPTWFTWCFFFFFFWVRCQSND